MNPFGVNLSFAVKRWPEPEAWAEKVAGLGLDLVQFTFDLVDPWWPEEHRSALAARHREAARSRGITIHSAFIGLAAYTYNALLHPEPEGRRVAEIYLRRAIDLASELGTRVVGGPLGGMSIGEKSPGSRRDELVSTLWRLAEYAESKGLEELLIEPTPLPREIPWTPDDACSLMEELDGTPIPFRLCVDIGHALYRPLYGDAADLASWLAALRNRIAVIHLQQTDGLSDSHWNFTRPEGRVEPASVSELLREHDLTDIPVLLEVFYPFELDDDEVARDLERGLAVARRPWNRPGNGEHR